MEINFCGRHSVNLQCSTNQFPTIIGLPSQLFPPRCLCIESFALCFKNVPNRCVAKTASRIIRGSTVNCVYFSNYFHLKTNFVQWSCRYAAKLFFVCCSSKNFSIFEVICHWKKNKLGLSRLFWFCGSCVHLYQRFML